MKTKSILITLVLSFCVSAVYAKKDQNATTEKKTVATVLKTTKDSLSYAIGVNVGSSLKMQLASLPGGEPNPELLLKAIADAYNGAENMPIKTNEEAIALLERVFAQEQAKESQPNKDAGEAFLAANKKRPEVKTTESGLQYEIITQGWGDKPTLQDRVTVHYSGTLIDGTVFDSSYERGEPATFGLTQVIPGWTEILQLMSVGSKWKIYLPYQLAYGERAVGGDIKPYSALIFEVELLDIEK